MTSELEYATTLNGAPYLLFELKQVLKLKESGLSNQEIRKKVIEDNIFQIEKVATMKRALPSIIRRIDVLDETLGSFVTNSSLENSRIINLYAIMKTDRLFYEFMNEVIGEKLQNDDYFIEKKDINLFFTTKAEQSEKIANWNESTINKLKGVFRLIIFESGFLKERNGKELNRVIIDEEIKDHLINIGDASYVIAMGE